MNNIGLGTYTAPNGTRVVRELIGKGGKTRKTVYLPASSPLKQAGIEGFFKESGGRIRECITAFDSEGNWLAQYPDNVKKLIQEKKIKI